MVRLSAEQGLGGLHICRSLWDRAAPGNREGVGSELYLTSLGELNYPQAVRGGGVLSRVTR